MLHEKIRNAYVYPQFVTDVIKPLAIEKLFDQQVQNLSGGEIQRVAICLCLGKVSVEHVIVMLIMYISILYYRLSGWFYQLKPYLT